MATSVKVEGFDAFIDAVKAHEGTKNIYALFSGSIDKGSGVSW